MSSKEPGCGLYCGQVPDERPLNDDYLRELELEEQDRRGYLAQPQREEEFRVWEDAAVWPET